MMFVILQMKHAIVLMRFLNMFQTQLKNLHEYNYVLSNNNNNVRLIK